MTEVEQLRKEINELRERVAQLEARPFSYRDIPIGPSREPFFVPQPPFTITCGAGG